MKIVFQELYKTEIYVSYCGYIVIKQGDDNDPVLLSPDQARVLSRNLLSLIEPADELWACSLNVVEE